MKKIIIISMAAVFLSSCMTTKTAVGSYKESTGDTYTYAKTKQIWLFWGLVPLGRASVATPSDGSCQIITKFKFIDILIMDLTGGIIITQTIKVKAKRQSN